MPAPDDGDVGGSRGGCLGHGAAKRSPAAGPCERFAVARHNLVWKVQGTRASCTLTARRRGNQRIEPWPTRSSLAFPRHSHLTAAPGGNRPTPVIHRVAGEGPPTTGFPFSYRRCQRARAHSCAWTNSGKLLRPRQAPRPNPAGGRCRTASRSTARRFFTSTPTRRCPTRGGGAVVRFRAGGGVRQRRGATSSTATRAFISNRVRFPLRHASSPARPTSSRIRGGTNEVSADGGGHSSTRTTDIGCVPGHPAAVRLSRRAPPARVNQWVTAVSPAPAGRLRSAAFGRCPDHPRPGPSGLNFIKLEKLSGPRRPAGATRGPDGPVSTSRASSRARRRPPAPVAGNQTRTRSSSRVARPARRAPRRGVDRHQTFGTAPGTGHPASR